MSTAKKRPPTLLLLWAGLLRLGLSPREAARIVREVEGGR